MSEADNVLDNQNQSITNYTTDVVFLGDNEYEDGSYTNNGYDDETLAAGTLMGRVATTGKLVKLFSDNTNGSQYPVGLVGADYSVEAGETKTICICIKGRVATDKVVLNVGDTMETVISDRRIKDRIASDTAGIILVDGTELTGFDNQ